jgi:toxin-antitoxin system PIN domain toxin
MLAVDTNVLIYAHRKEASEHAIAWKLVRDLAEGERRWAIPWPCVCEFLSVVTNTRIWKNAASEPKEAAAQIDAWVSSPSLELIGETGDFWGILGELVRRPRVRGPVIHDARVAAICLAHGVQALVSRDRDFSLFPELAVENPF